MFQTTNQLKMFFGPCPGPCSLKHPVLHLLGALAIDSPSTAGCFCGGMAPESHVMAMWRYFKWNPHGSPMEPQSSQSP